MKKILNNNDAGFNLKRRRAAKMAGRKGCDDDVSGVLDIWDLVSGKTTTLCCRM